MGFDIPTGIVETTLAAAHDAAATTTPVSAFAGGPVTIFTPLSAPPPPPRLCPCRNCPTPSGAGLKGLFHPAHRVRYGRPRAGFLRSALRRNALCRPQPTPFPAGGAARLRLGSPAPPALTGGNPAMPDKTRCRGNSGHRPAAAHHDTRRIHDPHQ